MSFHTHAHMDKLLHLLVEIPVVALLGMLIVWRHPPQKCRITVKSQHTDAPCRVGTDVGCYNDGRFGLWVSNGCEAKFDVDGQEFDCRRPPSRADNSLLAGRALCAPRIDFHNFIPLTRAMREKPPKVWRVEPDGVHYVRSTPIGEPAAARGGGKRCSL